MDGEVSSDASRSSLASGASVASENVSYTSGVVLAILGTFLFALKSILIKFAFAAGMNPTQLIFLRMTMAVPFYITVLLVDARWGNHQSHESLRPRTIARAMLLGLFGYYLASYLDICGLAYISAQLERLTLFTYPTMVALLAWMFLGEQITPRILMAIGLSYAGIWLIYGQERSHAEGSNVGIGVMLVLGSALSYSLYLLFSKPLMQRIGSRRFTSLAMIGSAIFIGLHFVMTESFVNLVQLPGVVFVYGFALAFVCTVIPSYMINEAIVRIGATRTTVIGTVGPVLTILLAVVLLAEPTSIYHFAGVVLAIIGVSLVSVK
ncbi:DMT family transporter [Aeoliella mucimassa]|uniref:EamA-like transporter family protein n=1 Tax=Aeoliella mucimassa TaxID=2527972 RepID=A0A518AVH6_9BACT|nr:DMT family transporter [Aeoliella mucimassa]QDU58716.1 EamA-like transporter family protein [Aeoliella mucimassa]